MRDGWSSWLAREIKDPVRFLSSFNASEEEECEINEAEIRGAASSGGFHGLER